MARSFTEQEKKMIDACLLERAEALLKSQGVRKTTVDELSRSAGISKGAFYLFYESKEVLFFRVFMRFHERTDEMLRTGLESLPSVDSEGIAKILCAIFHETSNSFIPRLLGSGELSKIVRALPPEVYASHLTHDDVFVTAIIRAIPGAASRKVDQELVSRFAASFRCVFFILLHKEEIGAEYFDAALDTHIRSLVERLWAEVL